MFWHVIEYAPWILNWNLVVDNNISLREQKYAMQYFGFEPSCHDLNIFWQGSMNSFLWYATRGNQRGWGVTPTSLSLSSRVQISLIALIDYMTMYLNYYPIRPCNVVTMTRTFFSFFNNLGWPYHLDPMLARHKGISCLIDLNYPSLD